MNKMEYPQMQETLWHEKLDNGLEVFLLPKPGFTKTYATFTTRFGSIDNHFRLPDRQEELQVPDGIAHFLEHKMFEEPDGDVFSRFAARGASANAYTSFDRTVYLFSATGHIEENLETLLDFVQSPYFTDENVEKEKGIIMPADAVNTSLGSGEPVMCHKDDARFHAGHKFSPLLPVPFAS